MSTELREGSPPKAAPQRRGRHAERRALTQAKVMDACIRTLFELGFQATTTSLVAQRAGVSRGALLQQFPTRLDMILSAAEASVRRECAATAKHLSRVPPGIGRYEAMAESMTKGTRQPLRIALIELQLAARADPQLAAGLRERVYPVLQAEFADAWRVAQEAGIEDRETAEAQAVLTLASLWGLAIMRLQISKDSDLAPAFGLLKDNRVRLLERLIKP